MIRILCDARARFYLDDETFHQIRRIVHRYDSLDQDDNE
jgi:hypothetical protein